jgi:hypothetical protein
MVALWAVSMVKKKVDVKVDVKVPLMVDSSVAEMDALWVVELVPHSGYQKVVL